METFLLNKAFFSKIHLSILALSISGVCLFGAEIKENITLENHEGIRQFLNEYCIDCHSKAKSKGGVRLDNLPIQIHTKEDAQLWQDALDEMNLGNMPPENKKKPSAEKLEALLETLSNSIRTVSLKLNETGSKPVLRRLNKREYINTIKDILGIDVSTYPIISDETFNGFDTVGASLSFSKSHFEKYYEAGRKIITQSLKLRKPQVIKMKYEGETFKGKFEYPKDPRVNKASQTGYIPTSFRVRKHLNFELPKVTQEADYKIRVACGLVNLNKTKVADFDLVLSSNGSSQSESFFLTNSYTSPKIVETNVRLFEDAKSKVSIKANFRIRQAWIDYIEIEGPINAEWPPKAYKAIFPDQINHDNVTVEGAKLIISNFANKMFRGRKPSPEYIDGLVRLYQNTRKQGDSFEQSIVAPLAAILSSPYFLYRIESPADNFIHNKELAIRLSYMLTSTVPDKILSTQVANDDLHKPEILRQQIERLLAEPSSEIFFENFTAQWLSLSKFDRIPFDKKVKERMPGYIASARKQPVEFLKYLLMNNKSARDIINSDYSIVNGSIAHFWGLNNISTSDFIYTELPKGSPYGGILTMPAIMAMTSGEINTSPIERGAFVLRKILDDPPLPPPPNVPDIPVEDLNTKTPKQALLIHSSQAQCNSCHKKIDPLGLALENYDHFGKWRNEWQLNTKVKINTKVKLANGTLINTPYDLKNELTQNIDNTVKVFIKSLIIYGLGRNVSFKDMDWIHRLITKSKKEDYKLKTLLIDFISSPEFRK